MNLIASEPVVGFSIAIAIMLGLALLEILGLLFGLSLSGLIDEALPDFEADLPDADVTAGADVAEVAGAGPLAGVLAWLAVGKVPFVVLLVIFLTIFGLSGIVLQVLLWQYLGFMLPFSGAAVLVLVIALTLTGRLGNLIGRKMPKAETQSISREALVGRIARITLGEARGDMQAEGRITDQYGTRHYIQILSDRDGVVLNTGDEVLIVGMQAGKYLAISNPHQNLSDRLKNP
ncbi:OB-fold-containig protein [Flexibacterium corallicola]|uniref:OB-fold-containig protein n=1 Tax=Flexibacterium corallicola TaxID=3037259 RepID=UPI00286F5EBB|nr:OB-fold-containig protein [Pseudovibrio sp. M1P-2-3]